MKRVALLRRPCPSVALRVGGWTVAGLLGGVRINDNLVDRAEALCATRVVPSSDEGATLQHVCIRV